MNYFVDLLYTALNVYTVSGPWNGYTSYTALCAEQKHLSTPERQSMTTEDVVEQVIHPLVGARQCSLLLYAGLQHGGPANLYVAHAWR